MTARVALVTLCALGACAWATSANAGPIPLSGEPVGVTVESKREIFTVLPSNGLVAEGVSAAKVRVMLRYVWPPLETRIPDLTVTLSPDPPADSALPIVLSFRPEHSSGARLDDSSAEVSRPRAETFELPVGVARLRITSEPSGGRILVQVERIDANPHPRKAASGEGSTPAIGWSWRATGVLETHYDSNLWKYSSDEQRQFDNVGNTSNRYDFPSLDDVVISPEVVAGAQYRWTGTSLYTRLRLAPELCMRNPMKSRSVVELLSTLRVPGSWRGDFSVELYPHTLIERFTASPAPAHYIPYAGQVLDDSYWRQRWTVGVETDLWRTFGASLGYEYHQDIYDPAFAAYDGERNSLRVGGWLQAQRWRIELGTLWAAYHPDNYYRDAAESLDIADGATHAVVTDPSWGGVGGRLTVAFDGATVLPGDGTLTFFLDYDVRTWGATYLAPFYDRLHAGRTDHTVRAHATYDLHLDRDWSLAADIDYENRHTTSSIREPLDYLLDYVDVEAGLRVARTFRLP